MNSVKTTKRKSAEFSEIDLTRISTDDLFRLHLRPSERDALMMHRGHPEEVGVYREILGRAFRESTYLYQQLEREKCKNLAHKSGVDIVNELETLLSRIKKNK